MRTAPSAKGIRAPAARCGFPPKVAYCVYLLSKNHARGGCREKAVVARCLPWARPSLGHARSGCDPAFPPYQETGTNFAAKKAERVCYSIGTHLFGAMGL